MKSFRSSRFNLTNVTTSSAGITPASLLADQCVKAFDQIPSLLQDVRSVSIPEGVITLEAGLERAVESGIGNKLADIIRTYVDNISARQTEAIQSALSTATTKINTCSEVAKKAQKKKKWDKDTEKRLEDNWFLFCMQMIKISRSLPLAETELRSIQALCDNALDVDSVTSDHGGIPSYHTLESRLGRSSDQSRAGSTVRSRSSITGSTVTASGTSTPSSIKKLKKSRSNFTLVSAPPPYSEAGGKSRVQEKIGDVDQKVLPVVQSSKPGPGMDADTTTNLQFPLPNNIQNVPKPQSNVLSHPQGLIQNYPHSLQSGGLMAPPFQPIFWPVFAQPYYQPPYLQQPQWPGTPPSTGVVHRSRSTLTESVAKYALDFLHPELKCPCHIRHSGDHPRCLRNCCAMMGCF